MILQRLTLGLALVALAGAAAAQTSPDPARALTAAVFAKAPDAAPTRAAPALAAAPIAVANKTAIDHRFDDDGAVTGSVGYLCGIDRYSPDSYQRGGGPTSSFGHAGTYLGANLGVRFR